jgi:hypothetical protein
MQTYGTRNITVEERESKFSENLAVIYKTTWGHIPQHKTVYNLTVRNYSLMSYFNFPLILGPCIEATERGHKDGRMKVLEIFASQHKFYRSPQPVQKLGTVTASHSCPWQRLSQVSNKEQTTGV